MKNWCERKKGKKKEKQKEKTVGEVWLIDMREKKVVDFFFVCASKEFK